MVFSSAIFMIAVYINQDSYFSSTLPVWTTYVLSGIALCVFVVAILGYVSYRSKSPFLTVYIVINSVASILFFIAGISCLIMDDEIIEPIMKNWAKIDQKLIDSGYQINVETFFSFVEINIKFAGLFSMVFSLFLIIGLVPAIGLEIKRRNRI